MSKPKISICIPVYKTPESKLRRALDTILEQTFEDIEIIIYNDGADKTVKDIIFSYNERVLVDFGENIHAKIRYWESSQRVGTEGRGYNIGLKNAQGEYIFFHDHDDYLYSKDERNKNQILKNMYNEVQNTGVDILYFNVGFGRGFFLSDSIDYIDYRKNNNFNMIEDFNAVILNNFFIWNKLFRREFLIENGISFTEEILNTDIDMLFKYIFLAKKIKVSKNFYYMYEQDSNGIYKNKCRETYYNSFKMIKLVKDTCERLGIYNKHRILIIKYILFYCFQFYGSFNLIEDNNPLEKKVFIKKFVDIFEITDGDIHKLKELESEQPRILQELSFYI